jgi:prevent-host-death family protein
MALDLRTDRSRTLTGVRGNKVIHLCSHRVPRDAEGERKDGRVERVGARELKQHTGEIIERVRMGERVLITHRGEAVAVISPIDREALQEALVSEAERAEKETLGWLAASEGAFSFWENEDDAVWDETGNRAAEGAEG